MKTYTELDDLRDRITEAELAHANEVRAWEAQANPIRTRIAQAEEWANASGEFKHLYVARRDLAALGPCPVEPMRLGMWRSRLARIEGGLR